MIIKISKNSLLTAVNIAKLGIASNPILPILEEIKVVVADGIMTMQATDNNLGVTIEVAGASVEGEGKFTFTSKCISLVPKLKNEEITLSLRGNVLFLKQGKNSYKFPISDPDDFPRIKQRANMEISSSMEVEYSNFKSCLISSLKFCTKNEAQVAMTGVFMEMEGEYITLTATDAHILSNITIENPAGSAEKKEVIIPPAFANCLKNIKSSPEFCTIAFSDTSLCIEMENVSISCRLIDDNFPNYRAIMQKTNIGSIEFEKSLLLDALKRLSLLANRTTKSAALLYQQSGVAIVCKDIDLETDGVEVIAGEDLINSMTQEGFLGINIDFMLTAISVLDQDKACVTFTGHQPNKPILITEETSSVKKKLVVMPVMLDESNFVEIRKKI